MKEKSFDETWEEIHKTQEWGKYPTEHVIRFIARNYYKKERSKIRILDFGCGGGSHTWYLSREGFDVYAFDGSTSAVDKVRARLKSEGLHAHLEVMDALELIYEKDFFDVVVDNVSICPNTKNNIIAMYKSVFNMLKPGGKLLTVCFGEKTSGYNSGDEIESGTYANITKGVLANRGIEHVFSLEELLTILSEVGFCDICHDTILYSDSGNWVEHYVVSAIKQIKY